jgi:hypothetical protein
LQNKKAKNKIGDQYIFTRQLKKYQTLEKKELPMVTMFLSNQDEMRKSYRGFSIDASF